MRFLQKRVTLLSKDDIYLGMFDLPRGAFMLFMMFVHASFFIFPLAQYANSPQLTKRIFLDVFSFTFDGSIPLLFLMCGYGWRKRKHEKAVKTQCAELVKPYILVVLATVLLAVLYCLFKEENLLACFKRYLLPYFLAWETIMGSPMENIGPVWCLVTYCFSSILFNAILQEEDEWIHWVVLALLVGSSVLMHNHAMPFCIIQTMVCTAYMYIGWKMKKTGFLTKEIPVYLCLALFLFPFVASYKQFSLFSTQLWPRGAVTLLSSLFSGIVLLFVLLKMNRFEGRIAEWIRWLGRNAMPVACAHTVFFIWFPLFVPIRADNSLQKIVFFLLLSAFFIVTACGTVFLITKLNKIAKKHLRKG